MSGKYRVLGRKDLHVAVALATLFVLSLFAVSAYAQSTTVNFPTSSSQISNNSASTEPELATVGTNTVYAVWDGSVYFAASTNNGISFGTPIHLNHGLGTGHGVQIAATGTDVYVVWQGGSNIYFTYSTNSGVSFSTPEVISGTLNSEGPQITADGSSAYVSWTVITSTPGIDQVYFRAISNSGTTLGSIINLQQNEATLSNGLESQVYTSSGTIYVVYNDYSPGNERIFVSVSSDGGKTFTQHDVSSNVKSGSSERSREPQGAISGSTFYAYWVSNCCSGGNYQLYVSTTTNGGSTWSAPVDVSNDQGGSHEARAVGFGSTLYITWHEQTPGHSFEIFFASSTNNGATFSKELQLSNDTGTQNNGFSVISASGSKVYVGWPDDTHGNWEIYFRASQDGGATFAPTQNLSHNSGASGFFKNVAQGGMQMSAQGNYVYVIWPDNTPGTYQIFFLAGS